MLILCLCALSLTVAQDKDTSRLNSEKATRIADNLERTIRSREPKWRLKNSSSDTAVAWQLWGSGGRELDLRVYVYDAPEEASKMLHRHGGFSVAASQQLEHFGEEARFISHRYYTWVGVRRGRLLATAHGPGRELTLTRRFAQHALEEIQDQ